MYPDKNFIFFHESGYYFLRRTFDATVFIRVERKNVLLFMIYRQKGNANI
jgi:hypothetical protein